MNNNKKINYVKNILEKKCFLENELSDKYNQINTLKYKIKLLNNELYKKCQHNWVPDSTCYGEHTTFRCEHCMLLS